MLFSATQTKSVKDLARLSLRDPEFLAVHAESAAATPARLQQTVMIVPLDEKMDMLWSFVKTHLQTKMLVFLSSCKQVDGAPSDFIVRLSYSLAATIGRIISTDYMRRLRALLC